MKNSHKWGAGSQAGYTWEGGLACAEGDPCSWGRNKKKKKRRRMQVRKEKKPPRALAPNNKSRRGRNTVMPVQACAEQRTDPSSAMPCRRSASAAFGRHSFSASVSGRRIPLFSQAPVASQGGPPSHYCLARAQKKSSSRSGKQEQRASLRQQAKLARQHLTQMWQSFKLLAPTAAVSPRSRPRLGAECSPCHILRAPQEVLAIIPRVGLFVAVTRRSYTGVATTSQGSSSPPCCA